MISCLVANLGRPFCLTYTHQLFCYNLIGNNTLVIKFESKAWLSVVDELKEYICCESVYKTSIISKVESSVEPCICQIFASCTFTFLINSSNWLQCARYKDVSRPESFDTWTFRTKNGRETSSWDGWDIYVD